MKNTKARKRKRAADVACTDLLDRLANFLRWAKESGYDDDKRMEIEWDAGWVLTMDFEDVPRSERTLAKAVQAAATRKLNEARRYWKEAGGVDEEVTRSRREYARRLGEIIRVARSNARTEPRL